MFLLNADAILQKIIHKESQRLKEEFKITLTEPYIERETSVQMFEKEGEGSILNIKWTSPVLQDFHRNSIRLLGPTI